MTTAAAGRPVLLRRSLRLEYLTVGWNIVEGLVAIAAAAASGSVALLGVALGSRAMTADAFQADACFWLSLFLLVGIGANALLGWWWADPLAALGMTVFIGREALEAWQGEEGE